MTKLLIAKIVRNAFSLVRRVGGFQIAYGSARHVWGLTDTGSRARMLPRRLKDAATPAGRTEPTFV